VDQMVACITRIQSPLDFLIVTAVKTSVLTYIVTLNGNSLSAFLNTMKFLGEVSKYFLIIHIFLTNKYKYVSIVISRFSVI
jgi:hypothetical protein